MKFLKSAALVFSLLFVLNGCGSNSNNGEKPAPIADMVKPIISLKGEASVTVIKGKVYTDAGATASDNVDGNITSNITVNNPVNSNVLGFYTVSYHVKDAAGNVADKITRTVRVINVAPIIGGIPKTSTHIYDSYQFQPIASDNNHDQLTFSITNKPDWASFDRNTGRLSGIATELQTHDGIIISVSDGDKTIALKSFGIIVKGALDIAHKFGVATQGTKSDYGYYGAAVNVLDNNDETYNHTRGGAKAENWLQIALPKSTNIHQVIIQSRQGAESRLSGAKVYLSESPYADSVTEDKLIFTLAGTRAEQAINLESPRTGSYLIIKGEASPSDNKHIHLIKVEVYGTAPVTPHINAHDERYLIAQNSEIGTKIMHLDAVDYQDDILIYSINHNDFAIDNNGNISVNAELTTGEHEVTVTVSDGINSTSTNLVIQVTSVSAVEDVLKSGDVVHTPITEDELIQATLGELEASKHLLFDAKIKIFNLNNDGTAKADGSSLTQIDWQPTWDASTFISTPGENTMLLESNAVEASGYTIYNKTMAIIGQTGENNIGRYMVMASNPLRTNKNAEMEKLLENSMAWLTGKDNLKTAPFSVVIVQADNSYYFKDETKTREWFDTHYTGQVSYNAADSCDGAALAACLNESPDLLIISQIAAESDNVNNIAAIVKSALNKGVPVLYIHNDGNLTPLGSALLSSVFHVTYEWDNRWKRLMIEGYNPVGKINTLTRKYQSVQTLFSHLKNQDYNFNWSQCVDSKGEQGENNDRCGDIAGLNSDFQNGADTVRNLLNHLDKTKNNIFLNKDYRLYKLLALTADKFRQSVSYPMDKVLTDDNTFMRSYYADHATYNYRTTNPVQPDMGNFSRSDFSHITPITKQVNLTSKRKFRSAGVYALPGKTVRVTRTDNRDLTVKVFINTLRSGATHQYQKNAYNRPKYLQTPYIEIKSGETIEFTSPYGGPLQVAFNKNNLPVDLTFENIGEHPYWASTADDESFAEKLAAGEYDWAEVATAGFEVHSKLDKMRASVEDSRWGGTAAGLAAAVVKYTSNYPHVLAGFKGEGVDVVPEIHDWANEKGLTIETIDIMKHMNADQATCGYGCSGNPYDAYWAFNPTGHGDIHEMGHSMQKMRFEGFPNHAATNTFSYYTKSRYTANTGDTDNDCWGMPFKSIYETIQSSVGNTDVKAYLKTNLWDKAGLREQYLLKIEAMMHAQKMGKVENGWHVLARVHILEREMSRAKKDWDARKASVGFDQYTLDEIESIKNNDWLIVAYSYAAGLDYTNYFDMMGIPYSQKARDQIKSFGFEVVPNGLFKTEGSDYCSSPNLFSQPLIAVDGQSVWSNE